MVQCKPFLLRYSHTCTEGFEIGDDNAVEFGDGRTVDKALRVLADGELCVVLR